MALVIPDHLQRNVYTTFNHLGGTFLEWLQWERNDTLSKLADAQDERVLRQLQGRARFIKELIEQIQVSQR
jgi:hypothetical protein